MKAFSKEEVLQRFNKNCGTEFFLIGEYKTSYQKVLVQHNSDKCNYFQWETVPKNTFLKKKLLCPMCSGNSSRLDREQFFTREKVEALLAPDYEILEPLRGRKDLAIKIRHNSENCSYAILYASPNKIMASLNKKEELCPICRVKKL